MRPFMDADFMINNEVGKKLYHEYAEKMPIYDYHCHLKLIQILFRMIFYFCFFEHHYSLYLPYLFLFPY